MNKNLLMYKNLLKDNILLILAGIILILVIVCYLQKFNVENFAGSEYSDSDIQIHPDLNLRKMLQNIKNKKSNSEKFDEKNYVRRTDIARAAREVARDSCPVNSDFDLSQYVKKTEIKPQECPSVPDLKNYVLKSSIPPEQKCPSCVCPKLKVHGKLCKACPEPKKPVCPPCKPCGHEECKNVIKCAHGSHVVPPCPKCPAPQPCKKEPVKICPAIKLPNPDELKCPESKPCPIPKKPKCNYQGIKYLDKDVLEMINELLNKNDTDSRDKLEKIQNMLKDLDLSSANELLEKLNKKNKALNKHILRIRDLENKIKTLEGLSQHDKNTQNRLNQLLEELKELKEIKENNEHITEEDDEYAYPDISEEKNVRRNNGEDTDDEDIINNKDKIRPIDIYSKKCASSPLNVKKYNKYKIVGASLI